MVDAAFAFFLENITAFVSWTLVISGWFYVRKNGHYFAKRSELRAYIKDAQDVLKNLEENARTYWTEDLPEDVIRSKECIDIMVGLTRLEHHLKQIQRLGLGIDVANIVSLLREEVTGEGFAQKNKPALRQDDQKIIKISTSINRTYIKLDEKFENAFSSPFPRFFRIKSWLRLS